MDAAGEARLLIAHAARVDSALTLLGSGLRPADRERLAGLRSRAPSLDAASEVRRILAPYVLASVEIDPAAGLSVTRGAAEPELAQHGWTSFLVEVRNRSAVRGGLRVSSPNSAPLVHPRRIGKDFPNDPFAPEDSITAAELARRFLETALYELPPMRPGLSGQPLEYVILQVYSKDAGRRDVRLDFHVGDGDRELAMEEALAVPFQIRPAVRVRLRVMDSDGSPTMASFIISDGVQRVALEAKEAHDHHAPLDSRLGLAQLDRTGGLDLTDDRPDRLVGLYPLPSRRLAKTDEYPDFYFQPQIYRADGEHVLLAPGTYEVEYTRGPEYLTRARRITVPQGVSTHEEAFRLERWVDMSALGWHSYDHHVHAAGCSHYDVPEEGVRPEHMWRQLVGEDLDLASVLNWGPGWYHQKQFFDGHSHPHSTSERVMRYDVEVSKFPSAHAGHLVLLGLREDDYPGTQTIEDWPSWTLPVLEWAKGQEATTGYAHSGHGLAPVSCTAELPNYVMPRMDYIGANEYVVTITKEVVDFYSAGDTPPVWELNMWYHTLNAGFRPRLMGESDFPCITDERIGLARTYAKVDGALTFESFLQQATAGRSYVSDGRSHLIDFRADGRGLGTGESELRLPGSREVTFTARVSAFLPETRDSVAAAIAARPLDEQPYWGLVRSRIGESRRVPVELVVNGYPVARREIVADGTWQDVAFTHRIDRSSWAALRVFPSSHTNPIFLLVDGRPIRASRRSAEWLRAAVDQTWETKAPAIRETEREAAAAAYDHARRVYERIIAESPIE